MEIKFDHVSFVIDAYTPLEKTIISDVSFEIKSPGIYSFIGRSNSGKTAIGDLINALIMPTNGKVKIGRFINDGRMNLLEFPLFQIEDTIVTIPSLILVNGSLSVFFVLRLYSST